MSFGLFEYSKDLHDALMCDQTLSPERKLAKLHRLLTDENFPKYVMDYILRDVESDPGSVCFHRSSQFGGSKSNYPQNEIDNVRRQKGIFSNHEFSRGDKPEARNHLKVFFNANGHGRMFYKINGDGIQFIQNRRQ